MIPVQREYRVSLGWKPRTGLLERRCKGCRPGTLTEARHRFVRASAMAVVAAAVEMGVAAEAVYWSGACPPQRQASKRPE